MIVGCVKEIKNNENRVGLTPSGASKLVLAGHTVLVEKNAGMGSGFSDSDYKKSGAKVLPNAQTVWKQSELIVKVKEPLPIEWPFIQKNRILFTYFHFASNEKLLDTMLKIGLATIAYETVGDSKNHPLLKPMSEVAGKMVPLMGAYYLAKFAGGKGILVSKVSGVAPCHVVILGSGTVGFAAGQVAYGMQSQLTFLVHNPKKIAELKKQFPGSKAFEMTSKNIEKIVPTADLLIGAIYVFGQKAPKLVSARLVSKMKAGSVIVDVAIDQGGCIETSRPTTHQDPVFQKFGITHYCVANMPGAFPKTSTLALTNATFPYLLKLANSGLSALKKDAGFRNGLTTLNGKLVNRDVAKTFKRKCEDPLKLL
ncbi:MAG: alanine dehydrogenase [Candidatus Micrarchaeota archaeon]